MATGGQRGFTLVEMVVVLAITAVALTLAAGVLREAAILSAAAGRQLHDPLAEITAARLRADLQGADRVLGGSGGPGRPVGSWSGGALELVGYYPSTVVRYEVSEGELHRVIVDSGSGAVLSRKAWLQRLVSWRWRQLTPRLVEVRLTYLRAPEASSWRLAGGPPVPPPDEVAAERLVLALRGEGRGAAW